MIVAVDFDDTLFINGKPNLPLIEKLKAHQRKGDAVILFPAVREIDLLKQYGCAKILRERLEL